MNVISVFFSYSEVLTYLDEARKLYKIISQKYEEEVGIVLFGEDKIYYEVIIKLLKDA